MLENISVIFLPFTLYSADDVASDFTLRGVNVQSIHGGRYVDILFTALKNKLRY